MPARNLDKCGRRARGARPQTRELDRYGVSCLAVLVHGQVPPDDGGISVGQAVIAALAEGL
jgi:hypothetical protein